MLSFWAFLKDGYSVQKCDLREERKKDCFATFRSRISECVPSAEPASSASIAGVRGGRQRIDRSPLFWSLDFQKQDLGDTGLHVTEETHYASASQASPYAVHHSSVGIASPLQIRKLRPECSHSGGTNVFHPLRSDHGPTPRAAHPIALLLSRGQFPHPQRKLQKGDQ